MIAAISFLLAFLVAAGVASVAVWVELHPWRKAAQAHWTERARSMHPARRAASGVGILLAGIAALASLMVDRHAPWIWVGAGAWMGALLASFSLNRRIFPALTFVAWLRTFGINLVFVVLNWGSLVVAVLLMPPALSWKTWLLAGSCLAIFIVLQFGLGVRLLRLFGTLRPASPRVQRLVDEISAQCGVRPRAVWEIETPAANAAAYVTIREIAFTTGFIEIATDAELKAVCAHELAHLAESRAVVAARIAGRALLFPLIFIRPISTAWPNVGVLGLLVTIAVGFYLTRRLSQTMERKADKAALQSAADPRDYVQALEKIYEKNLIPAVLRSQRLLTHPNLYDRLLAAGVPVAYERPKKPRQFAWTSFILMAAFSGLVGILLAKYG